jgi:type II secretory pathway pseudopilin PulG
MTPPIPRPCERPPFHRLPCRGRRQAGFTLAEMLVSLAVSIFLILSVLAMFEANARITRVQTDVADMQQSQRIAQFDILRLLRMAGRGGLPQGPVPLGIATAVRDDVPAPEYISPGDASTPQVLIGTDVLTVRGVFGRLYQLFDNATVLNLPTDGSVTITDFVPLLGAPENGTTLIPQDLQPLRQAVCDQVPEALVVVSNKSNQIYGVVELDPSTSNVGGCSGPVPATITIGFKVQGGTYTDSYGPLSSGGAFAGDFPAAASIGILEEYRYYVRDVRVGGQMFPVLSRARVFPGTEEPYQSTTANWAVDIADNVFDLQATYGVDRNGDGLVVDGTLPDDPLLNPSPPTPELDEWLFNSPDDDPADAGWNAGTIYYLRITSLVRTGRPDRTHLAPILLFIEDHDYGTSVLNTEDERAYRRRTIATRVDLRNL